MVSWESLLATTGETDKIVVSGCQRSGTTYAAKALSQALGIKFCDERDFKTDRMDLFEDMMNSEERMVIQAPAILHMLKPYEERCLIVIMRRHKADVVKSMTEHMWFHRNGRREWAKFSKGPCPGPGAIYDVKMEFAESLKKVDLEYSELEKTPGFVKERKHWSIKQTSQNP